MKVLVVDDNRVDRAHIRRIVERMPQGYKVDEAGDAGEALQRLLDSDYVCVFLDFMLPDMNGAELVRTLQERMTAAPPVILLSNSDDDTTIQDCLKSGAQDYLLKGEVSPSLVSRALRYALERHRREAEIRYLATHDSLTALFNRSFFNQYLEKAIERSARHSTMLGLLFVDLDKFKPINDEYGHEAGDAVLREVAARLVSAVRKADLVARLGGDEFVVLLEDIRDAGDLHDIGLKLLASLRAAIPIKLAEVSVTPSIGMTMHPRPGGPERIRAGDLLKQADHAMYQAKANGKNTLVEYTDHG